MKTFLKTLRKNTLYERKNRGFSLPELIIVIAIFAIISSIALFNQGRLSSSVLITNMAYEVGLAVREAQVYGIGVRSEDQGQSFTGQYGAHFSVADDVSIRQVIVYADLNGDYVYTPGEEKYFYPFTNQRGNRVMALCAGDMPPEVPCTPTSPTAVQNLDVVFKRPNPSALVYGDGEYRDGKAYIVLNAVTNDDCRVVIVESTGQIRVENSSKGSCQNSN